MARYFDVHPTNPQPRSVSQVADLVRDGGLVAYPTDSGFALGCRMGNRDALPTNTTSPWSAANSPSWGSGSR